ncbi:hypothetical protein IW262DRAFT_1281216, partial [Armillaria fumosa]
IRGFLWKALQNTFKTGAFWEHIGPQYVKRGECPYCKVTKTMEHILIECNIEGQTLLWKLAQELWEMQGQKWITQTSGVALGSMLIQIKLANGKVDRAATRMYRILITETVHMIWKEGPHSHQRIQQSDEDVEKWHSCEEIKRMWLDAMNHRLTIDQLLVNKCRFGLKALTKVLVLSMWRGTLYNERSLPED